MLALAFIINWLFFAYMSYKIGNKLKIKKSYPWYLTPLWNFWILAKNSDIKIKDFSLMLVVTLIVALVFTLFSSYNSSSAISILGGADSATSQYI